MDQVITTRRRPKTPAKFIAPRIKHLITTPSITLIAAGPNSGKSYLIRYIISTMCAAGVFDYGVVFTTTGKFNGDYDYLPERYVHSQYSDDKLETIMRMQGKQPIGQRRPMFMVFDDMTSQVNMDSKIFSRFIQAYRHYNVTVIFATHLVTKVSTIFRECTTHAIIFKQTSKRSYDALHENFFGEVERNLLEEFIKKYTDVKYQFLMVTPYAADNECKYKSEIAPPGFTAKYINY